MAERLSKAAWLKHGLKALTQSGFQSLKADRLAKTLGVSRGSFYWHFPDLASYHRALLDEWQRVTTDQVIAEMEQAHAEESRLADLIKRAYFATQQAKLDNAIRQWAHIDTIVQRRIKKIDQLRIDYLTRLLSRAGLAQSQAESRARFVYAASLGDRQIAPGARPKLRESDLEQLAELLKS